MILYSLALGAQPFVGIRCHGQQWQQCGRETTWSATTSLATTGVYGFRRLSLLCRQHGHRREMLE